MTMDTIQIRMSHEMVKLIDKKVEKGIYPSRGEAVRDAVRKNVIDWDKEVGTIKNTGNSVEEIRRARKILSAQPIDLDEINALMD